MNPVYKPIAIGLGVVGLLALSVIGISKAYNGIYGRGHTAGRLEERTRYQDALLKAQDKQLALQQQITKAAADYAALSAAFTELEQKAPEEIVRYVRQDPVFARSRRPAELHARRVRDLESLRKAAATH